MSDNSPKLIGQLQTQTLNLERGFLPKFQDECLQTLTLHPTSH